MKLNLKKMILPAAALLLLAQALHARRPEVVHEDIFIAKGQTVNGDVATDRSVTIEGTLDGDATAVGGASVTVSGRLTGDLVSMGGPVFIPGEVEGDVSSIGGPVEVSGRVAGNVSAVGGKVVLSGAGQVDGDISALGGGVEKGPKAVHKGDINSFSRDALRGTLANALKTVRMSARFGGDREQEHAGPALIGGLIGLGLVVLFSMLATGLLLMLLPAVFFPKNVENCAAAVAGDLWRACGIGAVAVVAFFPVLLMITVSILGIPLIPFALMAFAAAAVLGFSGFSVVLQGRFFEGIKKTGPAGLAGKVTAGFALTGGLLFFGKLIPLVGGLLSLIGLMLLAFGLMVGLGAAWMTRMGNQPYAAPAAPAPSLPAEPPAAPPAAQ